MKRLIALLAILSLTLAARAEVETYNIDPTHSSAGFSLRHVLSHFSSSFTRVTGAITVDRRTSKRAAWSRALMWAP
jgi:polyisoprenoid-binding protein YceI